MRMPTPGAPLPSAESFTDAAPALNGTPVANGNPDFKADFKADFLSGAAALAPFFPWGTATPDWAGACARPDLPPAQRAALVADLHAQYAEAGLDLGGVADSLTALAQPGTLTVTTGQQPGLFGGPLYTLHKTIGVIALARWLAQLTGQRVVPVFWMASEDHDWAEVNAAALSYTHTVRVADTWAGAVGRYLLPNDIGPLAAVHPLLAEAYRPGQSWAGAFRVLWHRLFAKHGLVVLDADRRGLKALARDLFARELTERQSEQAVAARTAQLVSAGYAAQILPRPINLFYLTETGRHRLVYINGTYGAEGYARQWNRAEIVAELDAHPERFSPNVVLRPVLQELLLPNVAYLGGWAEVQYWAQLGGVFAQQGVPMPVVYPRPQALVLSAKAWARWQSLGMGMTELSMAPHLLRRQLASAHVAEQLPHVGQAAQSIGQSFEQLAQALEGLDGGQARNVRGQAHRNERFLSRLRDKLLDRLSRRHPEWAQGALELQAQLQPYGVVQERTLAWPGVTAEPDALIAALLERFGAPEHFGRMGAPVIMP